ncbi:MAG: hypothetical protein CVT80_08165 [Alphaproteobacteria bacterium HGW-Alphaproteobacteria-2]|nr:MAG: hypothetical protein CVT80_08165 [Alphaproteobacteria bacterium HGW-Alphaproteobacteria-2]
MTRMRPILASLLVLAVALAGATLAGARGQVPPPGAVQVVLCTGTTITVITLDAEGNPVEERRLCPDYGLALFAAPPAAPLVLDTPANLAQEPLWPRLEAEAAPAHGLRPAVRGPPRVPV